MCLAIVAMVDYFVGMVLGFSQLQWRFALVFIESGDGALGGDLAGVLIYVGAYVMHTESQIQGKGVRGFLWAFVGGCMARTVH